MLNKVLVKQHFNDPYLYINGKDLYYFFTYFTSG